MTRSMEALDYPDGVCYEEWTLAERETQTFGAYRCSYVSSSIFEREFGLISFAAWNGANGGCWVADKTGMGHEGRLL